MNLNQLFNKYLILFPILFVRGEQFGHYLKVFEKNQWLSHDTLQMMKTKKLVRLINYARENVKYYGDTFQNIPIKSSITMDDFQSYPFITKSELVKHQSKLLSENYKGALVKKTTGGSTGQAVTILKSKSAIAQEFAGNYRGFSWANIKIGDKQGRFWGVPIAKKEKLRSKLVDFANNRKRFSAFSFSEQSMVEYIRILNYYKPVYLYGYVSMMTRFAEFLESGHYRLCFPLKAVITTSEVLTSSHRKLLERIYETKVFNEYGCGEIGTIAHECEEGSMHINDENMLVEIVDGNKPCEPNQIGEIVVTELNNFAMPLIRYRLGDFASFSNVQCKCSRSLSTIKDIVGRAYDLVYNREGKMFHGEFFMYIFEEVKKKGLGISAFQIIQDDYENFTIRVVPGNSYGINTEHFIEEKIKDGYGAYAKIRFVKVDEIKREKSGKLRLIKGLNSN